MTAQKDIIGDPKYIPVHNCGFVGLVDHMGSDAAIVQAARVSYGIGTKTVNEDRGLIRYLIRKRHTSPIEMAVVKLHVKMPIFLARQWIRHRTASINEYSGRYSIMPDETYLPSADVLQPQSTTNKQGREGELTDREKEGITWLMQAACDQSFEVYEALIRKGNDYESEYERRNVIYDPYEPDDPWFDENYPGVARELARIVLPLATYTEFYWKQDLHNLLHLIKLRRDRHAQKEIQDYAEAVFQLIKPLFPMTLEAWEDYVWNGKNLSVMDVALLKELLGPGATALLDQLITQAGGEKEFAQSRNMSLRELREFRESWEL